MRLPLYWIDAFSAVPFAGNPAAVVPLDRWLPDAVMQQIAFENGLAETAFLVPQPGNADAARIAPRYHLRWFTPAVEVDLCGHATLASGHVLLRELGLTGDQVVFDSRSGPLVVTRRGDRLELDFPATPVAVEPDRETAATVARALGRAPSWLGRSKFDLFAVFDDPAAVRDVHPDLAQVAAAGARGLIVTAPGDGTCDFVSRFFAPQSGVPEDPVTGSAHCALAPYWAERLGRTQLHARQVSRRGGELWCEVLPGDTTTPSRVRIAGHTTLYLKGEIAVEAGGVES